jgi:hypothetical protein
MDRFLSKRRIRSLPELLLPEREGCGYRDPASRAVLDFRDAFSELILLEMGDRRTDYNKRCRDLCGE